MIQSQEINELSAALSAFQGEVSEPRKDSTNPHMRTKYVSLASVWATIRAPLARHGLSVVQLNSGTGGDVAMTTQLQHKSGQWIRSTASLPADTHRSRNDVQAAGSTISYLRRYALLAILGLSAEDDDAASAASEPRRGGQSQGYDPLADWRKSLAECANEKALAAWLASAAERLEKPQQRALNAALQEKARALGTTIAKLQAAP